MGIPGALLTSVLALVTGTLVPAPATAAADPPQLRLRADGPGGTRSVEVPLTRRTLREAPGGSGVRTARLRSSTYRMAGLTWHGSATPHLRLRARTDDGWGAWQPMPAITDLPDARSGEGDAVQGTDPLWVGPADGVQVDVRGAVPEDLRLVLIDPGVRASDREVSAPAPSRRLLRSEGAPRPTILSRRDWGADDSWRDGGPWYNRTIQQVHVHHTVNANDYSRADVPALIRGMYRYHTHSLGWSDIGYNFLVDRFGRTWLGRAGGAGKPVRGAHTLGFNNTSTGVSVIGNFEDHQPPDKVLTAIVRLAAWKLDRYHRRPAGHAKVYSHGSDRYAEGETVRLPVIDGHRDTNETACPGQDLYDRLPGIRRRAQARVDRY